MVCISNQNIIMKRKRRLFFIPLSVLSSTLIPKCYGNNYDHEWHNRDGFKISITSKRNNNIYGKNKSPSSYLHNSDSNKLLDNHYDSSSPSGFGDGKDHQNDANVHKSETKITLRVDSNSNSNNSVMNENEKSERKSDNNNSNGKNDNNDNNGKSKSTKPWKKDISETFKPSSYAKSYQQSNKKMKRIAKGQISLDFGSYIHHDDSSWHSFFHNRRYHRMQQRLRQKQQQPMNNNAIGKTLFSTIIQKRRYRNSNNGNSMSKLNESSMESKKMSHSKTPSLSFTSLNGNGPKNSKIRVTVDPLAAGRLSFVLFCAISSLGSAFMGTLRLLAPLVVSRRVLVFIGTLVSDWYAGRYFRKTLTRMEKIYIHYYEAPATFRAISRSMSQMIVYLTLARVMGWLVGISHPPCRSEGRGLAFFCGLLWLGSVVGTGHVFSTAVALWGGPLRLQAVNHPTRTSVKTILRRPWHILQWLQNPEHWIRLLAIPERRPFDPNPIAFPATWAPLRLLQMVGVAKVAASEPSEYLWCSPEPDQISKLIKRYLIQLALCDEWCRVFIREKRLGLGLFVACVYSTAMASLIFTCIGMDEKASLLLLPSLLALIVSTWLNLVLYCNRYTRRKPKQVLSPIISL